MNNWQPVIGLEIHVQLDTKSKIFSDSSTIFGSESNQQANLVDLGYPGTLPVINKKAVEMAIVFGIAINGQIAKKSIFARKNYFYPDLPKGYQISQYDQPIIKHGSLSIQTKRGQRKIEIVRAHLEEDAGKSIHFSNSAFTGIDLNRAGIPLLEIVTAPTFFEREDVIIFLKKLHELVKHLKISDGNMQEGSFRCDANISVKRKNDKQLGTRTEIKNLNSFKFIEKAIDFEITRQIDLLSDGGKVKQETRLFDEKTNSTKSMRSKENEHDYRYFPDPDLLPVKIEEDRISEIKNTMPELPSNKRKRLEKDLQLNKEEIEILMSDPFVCDYYESVIANGKVNHKIALNWILGELFRLINENKIKSTEIKISPSDLLIFLTTVTEKGLSKTEGKDLLTEIWGNPKKISNIINSKDYSKINDDEVSTLIDTVLSENTKQVNEYLSGKTKIMGYLVGQVMRYSKGKVDPKKVNIILLEKIKGISKS